MNLNKNEITANRFTRKEFLKKIGAATAGIVAVPFLKSVNIFAYGHKDNTSFLAKVAITQADNYERTFVKQKVEYLFGLIGGITDVIAPGDKVAIKINLVGGSGSAYSTSLGGKTITETMWTHPEVLRAVGELVIDCGVSAEDLYIVEALWDDATFNNFGHLEVQNSLGAKMVNLNNPAPYDSFIQKEVIAGNFNFNSFTLNQILTDVDVYISIPKMKQHYEAGVSCSLKNQVGIVPVSSYGIAGDNGRRGAIHHQTSYQSSKSYLPRSICDLNRARPVDLAIIDGIKNARGGEGVWNNTFVPYEDHVLIAGKNPIAADSIAAYLMGNDPEAEKFLLPDETQCDNYLYLLNQSGEATNQISEIEVVGDGADLITSVPPKYDVKIPTEIQLLQNFPNPFNPATIISFYLPRSEFVLLKIYDIIGKELETLVNGEVPAGLHELYWSPKNLASGIYIYRIQTRNFSDTKKMIYQK